MVNTKEFTVNENDKEVKLKVRTPSAKDQAEAEKYYRHTFKVAAFDNKDVLRENLQEMLKANGFWSEKQDIEAKTLTKELLDNETKLLKGGIKASEGRALAIRNIKIRQELQELYREVNKFDNLTVQAQAEDSRFNCLVSLCTVYLDSGKPYFKSYEDYMERKNTVVGYLAAKSLAELIHNYDDEAEFNTTEYKFLRKMKFVDDKGRLINKDGHLIDIDGRLIDEFGYFVDENGERVDINGKKVDIIEPDALDKAVFLDEDGNPLNQEEAAKTDNADAEPPKTAE